MSQPIGETFVTITPIVDEAKFKAETESAIKQAQASVNQTIQVPISTSPTELFRQLTEAQQEAAKLAQQATLASAKSLIGQGSVEEATAAIKAHQDAALRAAQADVALTVATGVQSDTFATNVGLLQKRIVAEQEAAAAALKATAATDQEVGATRRLVGAQQTLRGTLRNVFDGRTSIGTLFNPATLAGFAAGGLAIGAVFQGIQHLQEALKVTGDEALTTEGKFRNFGAALVGGDVVGAFIALGAHAESASTQFKKLQADANATSEDFTRFGERSEGAADKLQKVIDQERALGDIDLANKLQKEADGVRDAADAANDYAAALINAEQATKDFQAQIAFAGSDAAQFGEHTRGPGDVPHILTPRGKTGGTTDSTATTANENAIAESRASRDKSLANDLAQAEVERQQAVDFQKLHRGEVEGRLARQKAVTEATTKVAQIQRQIDDAQAAAEKEAAAARERRRKEAEAARKKALADAAAELRESLDFREQSLQLELQNAQTTLGLGDDRKALTALIAFTQKKSENLKLERSERLAAKSEHDRLQNELKQLNRQALADALGVKEENLRTAIEAAKLTDDPDDDKRAENRLLKFYKQQVEAAKKIKDGGKALADARAELTAFQVSLKDKGGSAFTLQDLFEEAASEQKTFGSNITGDKGPLSGQDARGQFAGVVASSRTDGVQAAQLTTQERMARSLANIESHFSRATTGRTSGPVDSGNGRRGSLSAIQAAQEAARFGLTGP